MLLAVIHVYYYFVACPLSSLEYEDWCHSHHRSPKLLITKACRSPSANCQSALSPPPPPDYIFSRLRMMPLHRWELRSWASLAPRSSSRDLLLLAAALIPIPVLESCWSLASFLHPWASLSPSTPPYHRCSRAAGPPQAPRTPILSILHF